MGVFLAAILQSGMAVAGQRLAPWEVFEPLLFPVQWKSCQSGSQGSRASTLQIFFTEALWTVNYCLCQRKMSNMTIFNCQCTTEMTIDWTKAGFMAILWPTVVPRIHPATLNGGYTWKTHWWWTWVGWWSGWICWTSDITGWRWWTMENLRQLSIN